MSVSFVDLLKQPTLAIVDFPYCFSIYIVYLLYS